jgi:HEAT repeat protein
MKVALMGKCIQFGLVLLVGFGATGCARWGRMDLSPDTRVVRREAITAIKAGIGYKQNPAVRVQAVQALENSGLDEALTWIRAALLDEHPGVRFAGCVAVGRMRDLSAELRLRDCLEDEDDNVRVAAIFALHRIGFAEYTGRLATYLLEHDDAMVRRNAALVLGYMEEPSAVKILAQAMRDADEGVRQHALEAMAKLSNREARQELTFMANAGVGSEEVFAINALIATGDPVYRDTFLYKLDTAEHIETRLASARGLGMLGSSIGYDVVIKSLERDLSIRDEPNDSPDAQALRVRLLALGALGAIGREEGLPYCVRLMSDPSDPRIQLAAAKGALEILSVR